MARAERGVSHDAAVGLDCITMKIDDHVHDDEESAENEHQPLDQRQVAVDHRVDRHVADAGIGEDALDDDRAADQEGELHAGQRQRRRDCVAQRLLQDEPQPPTCP